MKRPFALAFAALLLALSGLAVAPRPALAAASYDTCDLFVTSLPAVLSVPGTYCFDGDLSTAITSGAAVRINSDDVVLDCNDFRLDGLGGGDATLAYGVYANARSNAIVRNCSVRGFYYGILLAGGSGHLVEGNRLDNNTYVGVRVDGAYSEVRGNRIADTGGSTAAAAAFGIVTNGSLDILDNTVAGVVARGGGNGGAYGVYTAGNLGGSIGGNSVGQLFKDGTGQPFGIYNATSDRIVMRHNDVLGVGTGGLALRCHNANGSARDNTILGFAAGYGGCSNDGGNVFAP
jgi:parallel beta-helix repeat protein